jgi:hypothetical protein
MTPMIKSTFKTLSKEQVLNLIKLENLESIIGELKMLHRPQISYGPIMRVKSHLIRW